MYRESKCRHFHMDPTRIWPFSEALMNIAFTKPYVGSQCLFFMILIFNHRCHALHRIRFSDHRNLYDFSFNGFPNVTINSGAFSISWLQYILFRDGPKFICGVFQLSAHTSLPLRHLPEQHKRNVYTDRSSRASRNKIIPAAFHESWLVAREFQEAFKRPDVALYT